MASGRGDISILKGAGSNIDRIASSKYLSTSTNTSSDPIAPTALHDAGYVPEGADDITDPLEYYVSPFPPSAHRTTQRKFGQLLPHVVQKRLAALRTYAGRQNDLRHSPWRLNLVCSLAARADDLPESLKQLRFCIKSRAPLVASVLRRTSNLADMRDGLQPSQLEVAECFATKGVHLKRIDIKGRGRFGKKERGHSHMRVVLREIDFDVKIASARTPGERRKWIRKKAAADADAAVARKEREELEAMQRAYDAQAAKS